MTPSDKAEAERRYPDLRYDLTYPPDAISAASRAAYIAGREDERAAIAPADTVPVSRELLVRARNLAHAVNFINFAAEIDRLLAEGARG